MLHLSRKIDTQSQSSNFPKQNMKTGVSISAIIVYIKCVTEATNVDTHLHTNILVDYNIVRYIANPCLHIVSMHM